MRVECNYKIGIERKVREKLSEMVQPLISSVTFYASMKHYRAVRMLRNGDVSVKLLPNQKNSPLRKDSFL